MASSVVLRRHISDIIKCPICLDVLDAPTSLPCLHTFCLRCLRTTFAADYPGDVAACPICRQDFELPAGGPSALPKNFTLDGLVELNRSASVAVTKTANDKVDKFTCSAEISGDVSLKGREPTHSEMKNDMTLKTAENSTDAAEVTADGYDCMKCSPVGDAMQSSVVSTESGACISSCDKHCSDDVSLEFCFDCRVDLCPACYVTLECRRRVTAEMTRLTDALNSTYDALLHLEKRRTGVLEQLRHNEHQARNDAATHLQTQDELEGRLRALSAEKHDALQQLAAARELLDVDQTSLETFLKSGARRLATTTTIAGLLQLVKQLKTEANSLLSAHQTRLDRAATVDAKQTQTSSTELVATLSVDEKKLCSAIVALTSIDDELYVAWAATRHIDVFDAHSLTLSRCFSLAAAVTASTQQQRTLLFRTTAAAATVGDVTDLTSCRRHRCLYVAHDAGLVRRLDRRNAKQVVEWSVGSSAVTGLSVSNSSFNVLVCSRDSPTVRIYTPLGCPVCAISLQLSEPHGSLVGLVHALECSNSLFVIGVKQSGDRLACVYRNDASYLQGGDAHLKSEFSLKLLEIEQDNLRMK